MTTRFVIICLSILSSLLYLTQSSKAHADGYQLHNKVSFLSEYYIRGSSQTKERPAPQLLSILAYDSGVYAGFFISRVEFQDNDEADQEVDLGLGYNQKVGNWYYKFGVLYYLFPNADPSLNYDFAELDLALGYDFGSWYSELALQTSPEHFASSGHSRYAKYKHHIPINDHLKFKGHIAHRFVTDTNAFAGIPDSFDWELGFEYHPKLDFPALEGLELIAKYVDSDFKDNECPFTGWCDERLITGIAYNF